MTIAQSKRGVLSGHGFSVYFMSEQRGIKMDMRANAAGAAGADGKLEDKEPIDYESLGKLMRRVRKEHGLTQDQVVNIQGLNHNLPGS